MLSWIARRCGYVRRDAEIDRLEAEKARLTVELDLARHEAKLTADLLARHQARLDVDVELLGQRAERRVVG